MGSSPRIFSKIRLPHLRIAPPAFFPGPFAPPKFLFLIFSNFQCSDANQGYSETWPVGWKLKKQMNIITYIMLSLRNRYEIILSIITP